MWSKIYPKFFLCVLYTIVNIHPDEEPCKYGDVNRFNIIIIIIIIIIIAI